MGVKAWAWRMINFLLYGNFWIAFAAAFLCWQTCFLLTGNLNLGLLPYFVFTATISLYATHRLVSLARLKSGQWQERFRVIAKDKAWIALYAAFFGSLSAFLFFFVPRAIQWSLCLPALISILYVVPVIKGGKRIRDIHYLKIFLIALVWAWITVYLPAKSLHLHHQLSTYLLFLERFFFIFAITLPFDVRDLLLDDAQAVKTLPGVIGIRASRVLGAILLLIASVLACLSFYYAIYEIGQLMALLVSFGVAYYFLHFARPDKPDYYFTAYLDGTMILQFLLVLLSSY